MIEQKVKEIIADGVCSPLADVTLEASLQADLDADSLDLVELVMELEDAFSASISDEAAEKIQTVGDAVKYLEENS